MARDGEIAYLDRIGEAGRIHAVNKPYSDPDCGLYLMRMGAIMLLLPPPPATLLDLGCGTGWTSAMFAQAGYSVTGADLAPAMIDQARAKWQDLPGLTFMVADYESLDLGATFDCAVFFDALHHAVDERLALAAAQRALKPGGVCVTDEPGAGHSRSVEARCAVEQYGVIEKDMPPARIARLAREAGFQRAEIFPSALRIGRATYAANRLTWPGWCVAVKRFVPARLIESLLLLRVAQTKRSVGICAFYK